MAEERSSIEKKVEISFLLAFYGPLLTKHQQKVMHLSNDEDHSLSEIADELGVSRQGVHDTVSRGIKQLYHFEDKLGMFQRIQFMEGKIKSAIHSLNQSDSSPDYQSSIRFAIQELNEILVQGDTNDGF